ncbi:MAG TPA: HAMP domain-containing sensor histidine kinase [Chryseolinea sp.]|nr:HAMP domain-containing sensor histidine kinase [Chryseolinea sp.]
MKLLSRTNLYYIFFLVITFVIISGSFYLVVQRMIYSEVEERLAVERKDFEKFIQTRGVWEESCYFVEDKIELNTVTDTLGTLASFKDTLLFNRYNQQLVPFRQHSFYSVIGPKQYKVSIRKSLIESNKLLKFITVTMLLSLSVGLLLLFLFQRRTSKTLWQPFYETLSKAKSFEVNDGKALVLQREDIFEFNELNSELVKMTDKISRDYKNLKEFTENASHEIQTPLAMINSRVENLIQEKDFKRHQMGWIQDIHESTLRLSKLNHALLLLSKIDNGQFYEQENIELGKLVVAKLMAFDEIFNLKDLAVEYHKAGDMTLRMNQTLADILLNNLINNAIKHNFKGGKIHVTISSTRFAIKNTGEPLLVDAKTLFERFKKQNQSSSSLGLGLAIVKKICELYNMRVDYSFAMGFHSITIRNQ